MSENLSDFFHLIAEAKKERKKLKEEEDKFISEIIGANDVVENILRELTGNEYEENQQELVDNIIEEVEEEVKEINDVVRNIINSEPQQDIRKYIKEGLLNIPPNDKNSDPLTPLDQKFATLDDLQKHYKLFLNRIQQQLSTLGGGGETRLEFLDDVDTNSVKVNNKFLKYDATIGKWVGSNAGGGSPVSYATTYITSSSSYTITENDYYIGVNYAGAVTITLPTVSIEGTTYIVKDELGQASKGRNRYITILPSGSDLIDGRDRAILAFDYGSLTFVYRNGWRVV